MSDKRLKVVRVSSLFDETPEDMHRMDRIRAAERERRNAMTPEARAIEDKFDEEMTKRIVFGDGGDE